MAAIDFPSNPTAYPVESPWTDPLGNRWYYTASKLKWALLGVTNIIDNTVIDGSTNPVSGNAVFDAITAKNALATPFTPVGSIAATNVQAAIAELDEEKSDGYYPLLFEGDSLTDDTALPSPFTWPKQLVGINSDLQKCSYFNVATSGNSMAQIITQYASQVAPKKPTRSKHGLAFLLAGTNDIGGVATAADIYANLKLWWALARADGFVLTVLTIPKRSDYTVGNGKEAVRLALNALILSDKTLFDFSVNLDNHFTDAQTTDGIHFTTAVQGDIARIVNSVISGNIAAIGAFNTTFAQTGTATHTLPPTNSTLARTDASQVFAGTQSFLNDISGNITGTAGYQGSTNIDIASVNAWVARESNRSWFAAASSADGVKLIAADQGGRLYTSTDSGVTWTARENSRTWYGVASSSDGTKLVATPLGGQIYTSINSGVTWTARDSVRDWIRVASSSDGTKLVATVAAGRLYTSTDSGATWTARESNRVWVSISSSADGTKLVAGVQGGQLYTSTDSGATWTARENARTWAAVASSSDGTKLAAVVASGGQIYLSTDSGVTWTARESARDWRAVASSSDGTKLVAGASAGQLYTLALGGTISLADTIVVGKVVRLKGYTVATLPAGPTRGDTTSVTDAQAPAYLAAVVGGGAVFAPVIYNGTQWVCH